jgi:hypothetical protein
MSTKPSHENPTAHFAILIGIALCTLVLGFFPGFVAAHGPSCVFHSLFRLNCPFCGMTRDFVAILHGQQPSLNRFSWIAFFVVYLGYPVCFVWALRQGKLGLFHRPGVHKAIAAMLAVMLVVNNLSF